MHEIWGVRKGKGGEEACVVRVRRGEFFWGRRPISFLMQEGGSEGEASDFEI